MLLRLGRPARDDHRLSAQSARAHVLAPWVLLLAFAASSACLAKPPGETGGADLSLTIQGESPRVGPALVVLTLTDASKRPVTGARVSVEGLMTHPGMAPVAATVEEKGQGGYEARLDFTMAGDWMLLARADWAGGGTLERRLSVRVAP